MAPLLQGNSLQGAFFRFQDNLGQDRLSLRGDFLHYVTCWHLKDDAAYTCIPAFLMQTDAAHINVPRLCFFVCSVGGRDPTKT